MMRSDFCERIVSEHTAMLVTSETVMSVLAAARLCGASASAVPDHRRSSTYLGAAGSFDEARLRESLSHHPEERLHR